MSAASLPWLWLAWVLGPGAARSGSVLELYGTAQELWECVGREDMSALFSPAQLRRLQDKTPQEFAPVLESCQRLGVQLLCWNHPDYPQRLKYLPDAPPVLYCTGDVSALTAADSVAMIGSRRPSSYGVEAAVCLGNGLAQEGVCLVSGLAEGLDSEAHKAAVAAGTPTVAVLGPAIDKTYPAATRRLRKQVEQVGTVISEAGPGQATNAGSFLLRNRLIAGLSDAVCVVEAREKSGTMNTVEHARRYRRPVYAVPGAIFSPLCGGTNLLLEQGQAMAASSPQRILKDLGREPTAPQRRTTGPSRQETGALSPQAAAMAKVLTARPQGLEPLAAATGLNAGQALAALLELELSGLAVSSAGGQYRSR